MKKILLIDDEDINLFILQNLLRLSEINAEVIFHNTSTKGINYINELAHTNREELPDLILLDIEMPVMNGWDFVDEYRKIKAENHINCKLIIFTTSIIEHDIQKAKMYEEIDGFINKPMTIEMLKTLQREHFIKANRDN